MREEILLAGARADAAAPILGPIIEKLDAAIANKVDPAQAEAALIPEVTAAVQQMKGMKTADGKITGFLLALGIVAAFAILGPATASAQGTVRSVHDDTLLLRRASEERLGGAQEIVSRATVVKQVGEHNMYIIEKAQNDAVAYTLIVALLWTE